MVLLLSYYKIFVLSHCRIGSAISWSGIHHLVDPTGLDISVTRCLEDSCAQMPGTDIEILLRQLTVSTNLRPLQLEIT